MSLLRISALAGLCCTTVLSAAVSISPSPAKWQPMTVDCTGPTSDEGATSPNPFLDYRYQVRFTAPSGKTWTVNGYYDGDGAGGASGNLWRCRFLPDETGAWSWQTSFRSGAAVAIATTAAPGAAVAGSDGLTGTFSVGAVPATAPGFFAKGRLLTVGSYYPRFQDGSWFLKVGADSPETLFGYAEFDNTPGTRTYANHVADWKSGDPTWNSGKGKGLIGAMNYLAGQGINAVYFLTMNIGGDGKDTAPYRTVANWAGSTANDNLHFDLSKLAQWRIAMEHAQRKGLLLHLVLNEGEEANKKELDGGAVGTERRLYYRELCARFADLPAIQWNLCEEYDIDYDIGASMAKSWGAALADYDAYNHPRAVHNTGVVGTEYQQFLASGQAFTTTSMQDRSADNHAGAVIEKVRGWAAAGGGPRPVQIDEFDDVRPTSTDQVVNLASMPETRREYLWPCLFSGAAGTEIYAGGSGGYDQSLQDFRLFADIYRWSGIAHGFIEANLPYWEMAPADSLVSGESTYGVGGSKSGGAEVLAKPGAIYAVYYPKATSTGTIALPSGTWTRRWFDPRAGAWAGTATTISGGSVAVGAPPSSSDLDWVALFTVSGAPVDAPPLAAFSATPLTGTAPLAVAFNASASSDDQGIASYAWSFGDGATGSGVSASHTYAAAGTYTATLTVRDTANQADSESVVITVSAAGSNQAPTVQAGADQNVALPPGTATLAGAVQDDGLPGGALAVQWTLVSGPGTPSFADPNDPVTTVTFPVAGTYLLALTADDGALSASDSVQISVAASVGSLQFEAESARLSGAAVASANPGFIGTGYADYDANAGSFVEWTVQVPSTGAWTLDLRYACKDSLGRPLAISVDGVTVNPGLAVPDTGSWSVWASTAPQTLTLAAGTHLIRASAVRVGPNVDHLRLTPSTVPVNQAPQVAAGPDRSVTLPAAASLDGTVSDDGLPAGSSLTLAWTTVSGPGTVAFASPAAADTTATFSVAGTYVLRLSASDGQLSASDEVQVTVLAEPPPPAGDPIIAEAEAARLQGAAVQTKYTGFTGSGYADYDANAGSFVEWTVVVPSSGLWLLDLRYACSDSLGRPLAISVDGVTVIPSLAVPNTGSWSVWASTTASELSLGAGTHVIRATALRVGPNVDHLRLVPAPAGNG